MNWMSICCFLNVYLLFFQLWLITLHCLNYWTSMSELSKARLSRFPKDFERWLLIAGLGVSVCELSQRSKGQNNHWVSSLNDWVLWPEITGCLLLIHNHQGRYVENYLRLNFKEAGYQFYGRLKEEKKEEDSLTLFS